MVAKNNKIQKLGNFSCKYKSMHGYGDNIGSNSVKLIKVNGKLMLPN
jgi:hypothetical protein